MNVKVQKKYTYFECANRKSVCALPVVTERLAKGILEHIKKHMKWGKQSRLNINTNKIKVLTLADHYIFPVSINWLIDVVNQFIYR